MLMILISSIGLSCLSVFTLLIFCTTSIPGWFRINLKLKMKEIFFFLLHKVYTFCHSAEHGVFSVEPRTRYHRDEELWSVRVRTCVSHAHCVWLVVFEIRMKFVFELVAPNRRAACAVTLRIACLNHELFDYSVKYMTIVIAVSWVNCEIFDCFRNSIINNKLN